MSFNPSDHPHRRRNPLTDEWVEVRFSERDLKTWHLSGDHPHLR